MIDCNDLFGFSKTKVGGHTSRSMMLVEMSSLVRAMPVNITKEDIKKAVIEENILNKPTLVSRKKTFRHLTEIYGLDVSKPVFRVFWALAHSDFESLPALCLICAYARDPQLRFSFELIRKLKLGQVLSRTEMEQYLELGFPDRFSPAMKKSMAQNVNTTWTFGGHLMGRAKKVRQIPNPRPVSALYAMLVGYFSGLRGEHLLDSAYASLVAPSRSILQSSLSLAAAKGLFRLKQAGGIVEFDFSNLLTTKEMELLNESN